MNDDEKSFDLRDKFAIEIFNGLIAHSKSDTARLISDLIYYINYHGDSPDGPEAKMRDAAANRIEQVVKSCYKVADIMRKVRLSSFG